MSASGPCSRWRAIRRYTAYRAAQLGGAFTNAVLGLLRASVLVAALTSRGGPVGGFDRATAVTFAWVSQALIAVVELFTWNELALRVRTGDVAVDLCRPVDPQLAFGAADLGRAAAVVVPRALPILFVGAVTTGITLPRDPWAYVLGAVAVLLATLLSFACRFAVNLAAFWLVEVRGLIAFYVTVSTTLSGSSCPSRGSRRGWRPSPPPRPSPRSCRRRQTCWSAACRARAPSRRSPCRRRGWRSPCWSAAPCWPAAGGDWWCRVAETDLSGSGCPGRPPDGGDGLPGRPRLPAAGPAAVPRLVRARPRAGHAHRAGELRRGGRDLHERARSSPTSTCTPRCWSTASPPAVSVWPTAWPASSTRSRPTCAPAPSRRCSCARSPCWRRSSPATSRCAGSVGDRRGRSARVRARGATRALDARPRRRCWRSRCRPPGCSSRRSSSRPGPCSSGSSTRPR